MIHKKNPFSRARRMVRGEIPFCSPVPISAAAAGLAIRMIESVCAWWILKEVPSAGRTVRWKTRAAWALLNDLWLFWTDSPSGTFSSLQIIQDLIVFRPWSIRRVLYSHGWRVKSRVGSESLKAMIDFERDQDEFVWYLSVFFLFGAWLSLFQWNRNAIFFFSTPFLCCWRKGKLRDYRMTMDKRMTSN